MATVNPFAINTELADFGVPIVLEAVDGAGVPFNPTLAQVMQGNQQFLGGGLPPEMVAESYCQLLETSAPTPNVTQAISAAANRTTDGTLRKPTEQKREGTAARSFPVQCPAQCSVQPSAVCSSLRDAEREGSEPSPTSAQDSTQNTTGPRRTFGCSPPLCCCTWPALP